MHEDLLYVGIDAGADSLEACLIDPSGRVLAEREMASDVKEVASFIQMHSGGVPTIIGIEAGSFTIGLVRKLRGSCFLVHAFETRQTSKFLAIRKNKTDTNDARSIADIVRLGRGTVAEVFIKSAECQHLRSRLVIRQKLVRQRVASEGTIRSVFRLNNGRLKRPFSAGGLRQIVLAELQRIRVQEGIDLAADVLPVLQLCEGLRRSVATIDRALERQARENPVCKAFMQIPGVGVLTAQSFYSAIEDPARFTKVADIGAYFGLTPRIRQSGVSRQKVGISKMGNTLTRTHLVTAATVMMRLKKQDTALQVWAMKLAQRIGKRRARAALARKLAVVMLSMWKSGQPFTPDEALKQGDVTIPSMHDERGPGSANREDRDD